MIRTNLSTRPFYNERLVQAVLGLCAVIVLALTALNLYKVVRLSRENTTLSSKMSDDRRAADEYVRKARQTRQGINQDELKLVVARAREANTLIDSRTFSWTQFFNYIESTLPPEVMLAAVRPTIDDGVTRVHMIVLAKQTDDIQEFMDKLEATGAFEDILPRQQTIDDNGLSQTSVEARYVPEGAADAPPAEPKPTDSAPAAKPGQTATPAKGSSKEKSPPPAPAPKPPPVTQALERRGGGR
jgi:type IV pilus assembly protein PilN